MAYNPKQIIHGAASVYYSSLSSRDTGWDDVALPAYVVGTSFDASLAGTNPPPYTTPAGPAVWHHVGLTTEGVEVEYTPEFKDVEVDQLLDAAEVYKTKQTMTVNTTLAEATLEHLLFVWGLGNEQLAAATDTPTWTATPIPAGESELGIYEGALGESPVERQLAFVGPGPRKAGAKTERVYHLRRVLQTEASSHGLKRAEETVFPVSFRCLPDPRASFAGAGYGTIRERSYT